MNATDINAEKARDQAALSESLLANEQGDIHLEEQVVFVDEREVLFEDGASGDEHANVTVLAPGEKQSNHWRDAWAAVLFLAHQVAIFYFAFAWGIPALTHYSYDSAQGNSTDDSMDNHNDTDAGDGARFLEEDEDQEIEMRFGGLLLLCFFSSFGALLLGAAAISVMIRFAEKTIQISIVFAILCNAIVACAFVMEQQWIRLGMSLVCLLLTVIYARAVWHRVPFAASNLLSALTAVQANGGIVLVSLGTTVVVALWTMIWVLSFVGIYMHSFYCQEGICSTHTNGLVFVLLLFSFYWTTEVARNVMHVTTAGTVGTWWFAPDDACTYCSPAITDSLRRATTYSLGSICFGSLLTAILQVLHQICHDLRRRGQGNAIILCVVEFLFRVLESLVSYFNKWAYIYIGLYGYDYVTSGQKVLALFRERGWTTLINDHLVTRALSLVSFMIAALTGCVGMALATFTKWTSDFGDSSLLLSFLLPFICGLALSVILLSVVASAVDTVIVSFAESPLEFERNHPGLYAQTVRAWRLAFPEEFR